MFGRSRERDGNCYGIFMGLLLWAMRNARAETPDDGPVHTPEPRHDEAAGERLAA